MTLEVAGSELQMEVMDHHGLVAATCKDLGIAERINARIKSLDPRRVIQPGQAMVAMIINALGFTNRRLYLTPQFFTHKPISQLFGENICAEQLDDHALGKALDEIAAYGATKLYGEIAFDIALEKNLLSRSAHLDTTSMSLSGEYATDEPASIEVCHGYSKDHRPDLKQVILSLTMSGDGNIPIWMEARDGNSSDKKSFHETVATVRAFQAQLTGDHEFMWIADSALYTPEKLLSHNNMVWLSRVPENIKACVDLIERPGSDFDWQSSGNGYRYTELLSAHGGIAQRWLLVYSEQAYAREVKTFEKRLIKLESEAKKEAWHVSNQQFNCEKDALLSIKKLEKRHKYFQFSARIVPIEKYPRAGRPQPGDEKQCVGYQLVFEVGRNEGVIEVFLRRKGRFILATNELDKDKLSTAQILSEYKRQQSVENGFRFLKDPWFMVDSFYLKKRKRIEALMMVMTLCLLVYNFGQYKLRSALKEKNETLPNQLGKEIRNPALRWVFQIMEGIGIIRSFDLAGRCMRSMIMNLNELRQKIIRMFGASACQIYGIQMEIAGM